MQTVLTIAGFDPSGGAGVLADCKTFAAFGCFGVAAITSLTAQNTLGVYATFHQTADILRAQIIPLLEDFNIAAVKVGMLPKVELMEVVLEVLSDQPRKNIVVDPVLRSSSGASLIEAEAQQYYIEKILPQADLVTPNLLEVETLRGKHPATISEMEVAAQELSKQLSQFKTVAVLVKGGHLANEATDVLFDGEALHNLSATKLLSRHTHGTGCTLSSAIAACLAGGFEMTEAVKRAKEFVTQAIQHAPGLGKGAGPMNHYYCYVAEPPIR